MVTVKSCCSSANLGPGVDVASIALNSFHEVLELQANGPSTDKILLETRDGQALVNSPSIEVATAILKDYGIRSGIRMRTYGDIPWGAGFGSSGAASVAAAIGVDKLFGLGLNTEELLKYSLLGEKFVAGTPHPDNVAASLLGGLIVILSVNPFRYRRIPVSDEIKFFLIQVKMTIENKTRSSRELLPERVALSDAINNSRNLSMLLEGLRENDAYLITSGMNDYIAEPARTAVFPFYPSLKKALLDSGLLGVALSGAGPSLLCVSTLGTDISSVKRSVERILTPLRLDFEVYESKVCGGALNER